MLTTDIDKEEIFASMLAATPTGLLDGRDCIINMRDNTRPGCQNNFRQLEWFGFYVEFCMQNYLNGRVRMNEGPGRQAYPSGGGGATIIDCIDVATGALIDCKAHSNDGNVVVTNDAAAIRSIIRDDGEIFFYIVFGTPYWDETGEFAEWHDEIKGKRSAYSLEREAEGRPSRRRKSHFEVTSAGLYVMTEEDLDTSYFFETSQGRNSNGLPRPNKMALDVSRAYPAFAASF